MKKSLVLLLICWGAVLMAQRPMNGVVTTMQDDKPLGDVIVQLKGTNITTKTNKKGKYELEIPNKEAYDITFTTLLPTDNSEPTLLFSFDGYESQEVIIDTLEEINVTLRQIYASTSINKTNPKTSTTAFAQLDETSYPHLPSPYTVLGWNSKLAGVQINSTSNEPGTDATVLLRTIQNLSGSNQPLILLDGIYLNQRSLADLNPEDILDIEFLKGSASSAMYGSRGANGVIIIRTRRGKSLDVGESRVTYRTEYGISQALNQFPLTDKTNREVLTNSGPQPVLGTETSENTFINTLPALKNYQDSILFQDGRYVSNHFALEGRSANTSMMASASRLSDQGIIQGSDGFTRTALRLNVDHYLSRNLSFNGSIAYSFSDQDIVNTTDPNAFFNTALRLTPIFNLNVPNEEDGSNFDWDIDNTGKGVTNPLYIQSNSRQQINRNRLLGNFSAVYNANNWLQLNYSALLDRSTSRFENFLEKGFLGNNIPGAFQDEAIVGLAGSNGGGLELSEWIDQTYVSNAGVKVDHSTMGFDIDLALNFLYEDITANQERTIGEDLAIVESTSLDNLRGNLRVSSQSQTAATYAGIFQGTFNYKDKYIVDGGYRLERSSFFGERTDNIGFYKVGAAYRITEDAKLKGIQELKLRAAIGTAGTRPTYEQRFGTVQLQNGLVTKNALENPQLLPAITTEQEVGIDIRAWKWLDLSFSYILAETSDQILLAPLSGGTGFEGQWQNAGTLESTIYEATIGIDFAKMFNATASGFHWKASANFNSFEQTITQLNVPAYNEFGLFRLEEGGSLGTMYGEIFITEAEGLLTIEELSPEDFVQNELGYYVRQDLLDSPNEAPFKLRNEEGLLALGEIGNTIPDFRVGITNRIGFKGLEVYTLFDWKKGGDIYNYTKQQLYAFDRHSDQGMTPAVAATFYRDVENNGVFNNYFVEDGSYFMLREAAISYTFTQAQLKGIWGDRLESIQFSLIGRNLMTWTQYSGVHPDVAANTYNLNPYGQEQLSNPNPLFAIDQFNYPLQRTFTGSLRVVF